MVQMLRWGLESRALPGSARGTSISFASRVDKPSIVCARNGQKRAHQTRYFFSLSSPAAAPSLALPDTDRNVPKSTHPFLVGLASVGVRMDIKRKITEAQGLAPPSNNSALRPLPSARTSAGFLLRNLPRAPTFLLRACTVFAKSSASRAQKSQGQACV